MYTIGVIIDKSFNSLFNEYHYLVTQSDYENINIGSIVEVKLGHSTRKAFVCSKGDFAILDNIKLKYITKVINYTPLNNYQLSLYNYMVSNLTCSKFHILNLFIKNSDKLELSEIKLRQELAYKYLKDITLKDEVSMDLLDIIKQNNIVTKRDLNRFYDYKESKIKKLIDNEAIEKTKVNYQYNIKVEQSNNQRHQSSNIFDKLSEKKTNLIMPGSKRLDIYYDLINQTIKENKQILILVPEVAATYDLISCIDNEFYNNCVIINTKTTDKEMLYYNHLIKNNEVNIIIGTKKSLFLPYNSLDTIIVENEHDNTYYNNLQPFYNVIDLVVNSNIKNKILLSNTPSLITYSKAIKEIYNLVTYEANNTNIKIEAITDYETVISIDNIIKIKNLIAEDKKILIYYNYQGYASSVTCNGCGSIKRCSCCGTPLRYFQSENILKCVKCNNKQSFNPVCEVCHKSDDYTTGGIGVEKVIEVIKNYFDTSIVFISAEDIAKSNSYNKVVKELKTCNIVVATQAITNLSLINDFAHCVVINTDISYLSYNPYLVEKTYQDIVAIGEKIDEVVVQTKHSESHLFTTLSSYDLFYQSEMSYRLAKQESPYFNILIINTYNNSEHILNHFNERIVTYFKRKNYQVEEFESQKVNYLKNNYKKTVRIKYKIEDLSKILDNINNEANEKKILIEIKNKFSTYK